jgi:pilus assembly protein CpaF
MRTSSDGSPTLLDDLVALCRVTGRTVPRHRRAQLGLNVLAPGDTGAGTATLLDRLAAAVPIRERVVTCVKLFELD